MGAVVLKIYFYPMLKASCTKFLYPLSLSNTFTCGENAVCFLKPGKSSCLNESFLLFCAALTLDADSNVESFLKVSFKNVFPVMR